MAYRIKILTRNNQNYQMEQPNFIMDFVKEINHLRINPIDYVKKIEKFSENLKKNFYNKLDYFLYEECYPVYLIRNGKEDLLNFTELLKNFKEKKKLSELENIEELQVPFPKYFFDWDKSEYTNKAMKDLVKKTKGKYNLIEFTYFKTVNDANISAIVNLITEKTLSINIFNSEIRYIGVNYKIIDEIYSVIYIVFAK